MYPTNDLVNLKTNFNSGVYQLLDVNRKVLLLNALTSQNTSIDLSGFNAGVYFFRIQNDKGRVHFKKIIRI